MCDVSLQIIALLRAFTRPDVDKRGVIAKTRRDFVLGSVRDIATAVCDGLRRYGFTDNISASQPSLGNIVQRAAIVR